METIKNINLYKERAIIYDEINERYARIKKIDEHIKKDIRQGKNETDYTGKVVRISYLENDSLVIIMNVSECVYGENEITLIGKYIKYNRYDGESAYVIYDNFEYDIPKESAESIKIISEEKYREIYGNMCMEFSQELLIK